MNRTRTTRFPAPADYSPPHPTPTSQQHTPPHEIAPSEAAPARHGRLPPLNRAQRCLITTILTGGVIIAGIGFAGSYAAVRELAARKGFGTFAYAFPIGIDAGICVLLALDLLLTWIRIPFPLLRHTAWLLTSATIAFNGAAAWPDPLGTGMHAVIPLLFIITAEAARHAIGRIADITADTHMEGIRTSRWILSPVPTFRLWRRMKLWEIRAYQQVLHLEQERLVYQARLRSRYGRSWRRKAPTEALIPLRLARYGIPLTAPHPTDSPPQPTPSAPHRQRPTKVSTHTAPAGRHTPALSPQQTATPGHQARGAQPEQNLPVHTPHPKNDQHRSGSTHSGTVAPAVPEAGQDAAQHSSQVKAAAGGSAPRKTDIAEKPAALTTADRYYLAWTHYQNEHGHEPTGEQLSVYLAEKGIYGRGHKPISPANLRRYFLNYRLYTLWAQHRRHTSTPSLHDIIRQCAARGITAQYNKPITTHHLTRQAKEFERRWHILSSFS